MPTVSPLSRGFTLLCMRHPVSEHFDCAEQERQPTEIARTDSVPGAKCSWVQWLVIRSSG